MKTVVNPFYGNHGAPGQIPGFINEQNAQVITYGAMGPQIINLFKQFIIQPVTNVSGKVKNVINVFLNKQIAGSEPCGEHRL